MADSTPITDLEAEAQQVAVQAVPGAVFLRLRRQSADGSIRRMFVELTIDEATFLRRELDASIRAATRTGRR
ncbi:MAG: hypothetical protein ACREF3_11535 [Acetobacteraceae bacterium]